MEKGMYVIEPLYFSICYTLLALIIAYFCFYFKRFTDWKYSVRQKYRKLAEHRKKIGSGPPSDIKLSSIEERGLSVWGKVVVTGSSPVTTYDGVPSLAVPIHDGLSQEESNNNRR